MKIIVHKLDLYIISVYICRNKNEIIMKKQEMINIILAEKDKLWTEMMECIDKLGMRDPITDAAVARWGVINQLVKSLGL